MAEWTSEAGEYLGGYLRQVSALARHQGDDGEEIVAELREHIERETEASGGPLVTVDQLRAVLAGIGTPDQIAGVESALEGPGGSSPSLRETVERLRSGDRNPVPPPPPPQVVVQQPRRSRLGCWIAGVIAGIVVGYVLMLVALSIAGIVAGIAMPNFYRARMNTNENDAQWVMHTIAEAQDTFQEACYVDEDGDGVGDYGSLAQLAEPGEGIAPLMDSLGASGCKDGYIFTVKVTLGGPGREPAYTCTATPTAYGKTGRRRYFVDESGVIRFTEDGSAPTVRSAPVIAPPAALVQGLLSGFEGKTVTEGRLTVADPSDPEIVQYADPEEMLADPLAMVREAEPGDAESSEQSAQTHDAWAPVRDPE